MRERSDRSLPLQSQNATAHDQLCYFFWFVAELVFQQKTKKKLKSLYRKRLLRSPIVLSTNDRNFPGYILNKRSSLRVIMHIFWLFDQMYVSCVAPVNLGLQFKIFMSAPHIETFKRLSRL